MNRSTSCSDSSCNWDKSAWKLHLCKLANLFVDSLWCSLTESCSLPPTCCTRLQEKVYRSISRENSALREDGDNNLHSARNDKQVRTNRATLERDSNEMTMCRRRTWQLQQPKMDSTPYWKRIDSNRSFLLCQFLAYQVKHAFSDASDSIEL